MKRIALSAALLFSAIMPISAAVAAPTPTAASQSLVEYLGDVSIGGEVYEVYRVTSLGGGWY
jgi:hypothetical protein